MINTNLDPSDESWLIFIASKPKANIFHHPAWINLLAESYGYRPFIVTVSDSNGKISAGLPMMEVESVLTGKRWVSLPFTDHCNPLYNDTESLNELTDGLIRLVKEREIPKLELRWAPPSWPETQSQSQHVLHLLNLATHAEEVSERFHQMHRRNIDAARKRGVQIKCGLTSGFMNDFYRLHLSTRHRQGVPIQPRRYFDLLRKRIIDKGLGFILTAYKGDVCLAAAVFLHWQQALIYKYGASLENSLNLRPNNLLFWSAIEWGCENGYSVFDMGRTDLDNIGLRQFKSRWGAEEVPLKYSTISITPAHPLNKRVLSLMHSVIRHSPPLVCQATGELLYRHFG